MQETVRKRNNAIIRYNLIGVAMNLVLSIAKLIFGIAGHSHALILDSVNGLSDLFSSVLSIISSALGNRRASKQHPLGYGRLEYIFSLVITMIIMVICVRSLVDSVGSILHPHDAPTYSTFVMILTSIGVRASNLNDPEAEKIWDRIIDLLRTFPEVQRAHSPYVDYEAKRIAFSLVMDYGDRTRELDQIRIRKALCDAFPDMEIDIHFMIDY